MAKQYPADTVGNDGTVYPTVGENIRNSVTVESIKKVASNDTDKAKITDLLDVSAETLKTAIINLLTGKDFHFGGLDVDKLTSEDLTQIKTYLGIATVKEG